MTATESNALAAAAPPADAYTFSGLFFRCVTPLHIGCGQDVGIVDLPIIRERTTGYPLVPGSGIRGAFRDACESRDPGHAVTCRLFGSEKDGKQPGCVIVCDARILLFPVRSHAADVFHWITCPFVLSRYDEDMDYFLGTSPQFSGLPTPGEEQYAGPVAYQPHPLVLEELPFDRFQSWTFPPTVQGVDSGRVVLVSNDVFGWFVRHATIVTQHNHLSAAKTVLQGQLFSVEAVPPEAVFYGFVGSTRERTEENALDKASVASELRRLLAKQGNDGRIAIMLGGDEGTGLGLTRVIWS